jgi:hypothetical protein
MLIFIGSSVVFFIFNFFAYLSDVEELTPALDLLCSAIRESDSETQSKHFSEQLLNLTLSFLNKQIKELFIHTEGKNTSKEGDSCTIPVSRQKHKCCSYIKDVKPVACHLLKLSKIE